MASKLKALGLALVAAFALSAVAASAASASEIHSGSTTGTTFGTGEQVGVNELDTPAGTIKCTTFAAKGSFSGTTAETATVTDVTYSGCTAFGLTAHVDMMGCDYHLTATPSDIIDIKIDCATGGGGVTDKITITPTQGGAAICHIDVPEQTITATVINQPGSPDDIDVEPLSNITYNVERTAGGSKCPTNGHHADGEYTGAVTIKGFQNAAHTQAVGLTYL